MPFHVSLLLVVPPFRPAVGGEPAPVQTKVWAWVSWEITLAIIPSTTGAASVNASAAGGEDTESRKVMSDSVTAPAVLSVWGARLGTCDIRLNSPSKLWSADAVEVCWLQIIADDLCLCIARQAQRSKIFYIPKLG